jgi:hypothetical protein
VSDSATATGSRGVFVLADISGYTAFLQSVGAAHGEAMAAAPEVPAAYPMMTSLLDGIVEKLTPAFVLSKLEGDAVFAYASIDTFPLRGDAVLECVRDCYVAYRDRRDKTENLMLCDCEACSRLSTLELKFVLHHGSYVMQSIVGRDELLGPDVTMAHLLLKNTVVDDLGTPAYALVTDSAVQQLDIPLEGSSPHSEHYTHYEPIQGHVFAL